MSEVFSPGVFTRYAGTSIYFVIGNVTVGELRVSGDFLMTGTVFENEVLPVGTTFPIGYDSVRDSIYIALTDFTRVLEINNNGDLLLAGNIAKNQTIAWAGANWEIESDATTAWMNITGIRPLLVDALGDTNISGDTFEGAAFIALPTVLTFSSFAFADYEFPPESWIKTLKTKVRSKPADIVDSHLSKNRADGMLDHRQLEINCILRGATQAAYQVLADALYEAIYRDDLRLTVNPGRYAELAQLVDVQEKFLAGYHFVGAKFRIRFLQEKPFWVDSAETIVTEIIAGSPTTFNVTNAGGLDVQPEIRITAAADAPLINIQNNTDDSRNFDYNDELFLNTEETRINSELGTVTLVGTGNRIAKFDGQWLRLIPGVNSLTYTGANATIEVIFRNRYL